MAGYTRQSRPDITNGADITAPPLNAEFDQIETAFGTAGHTHDGTAGNAPKIDLATSVAGYLKQVNGGVGGANNTTATSNPTITDDTVAGYAKGSLWLNTTTNRIYVCVSDTASAAAWYELAATNSANNILPSGDGVVDLGAVGNRFADLLMTGNATIGGSITVTAASSFADNVDVTGALDVGGNLTVDSNTTVTGNTTLNGNTTIGNANTDTVAVNAQVSTNIVPNSDDARDLGEAAKEFRNLFLDGTAHIDTLDVDESATVAVDLTVGGNVQIDTNLDVDGVTTLNGNTTIGDANTDVLYVNSEIATSLVPSATNLRDLGTATKEFRDLYLDGTAHIDTLDVDENATVAGTLGVTGNTTLSGTLNTGGITGTSATFSNNVGVSGTATIATVDINGGNIDATQIGVTNPDTARFTTVETSGQASLATVDIDGGNIDGTIIGATAPDTATFTTATANNGFTGDLAGNVTAPAGTSTFDNISATGTITGDVTGDITGNVTASTGSSTFNDVTINGTLNMDAGTTATITNLSTPVNPGDAASKGYVDAEVSALVDAAPATLDTLNELAAAINDDANFSTTITNSIATKLPLAGGTMSGAIDMGTNKVTNAADPTAAQDLATKAYTDQQDGLQVSKSGDSMSGNLAMGSNNITGLATPTANDHAATKGYTDGILGSATAASASAAAAATSENNAAASATAAAGSASTASTASQNAIDALDDFTDIYLGAKSSGPSTDNDGDALDTGAIYWDTTDEQLYVYDGTNWQQAAFTLGQAIANIVEDTTPQLGGDLDLNTNNINGTGNINITGTITSSGAITGDLTGNASTATALQTGRSIGLGGDVSGSATFDGTGDITITATVADDSHNHTIANVDGLQTALDGKLGTGAKAADSDLLDGLNSTQFLRSDTSDTWSGTLTGTGSISSSTFVESGRGSGGVALTINDGYGNANVTFNHKSGVPEQNGQSGRIKVNTDSLSGEGLMEFELSTATVTGGQALGLGTGLSVAHDYIDVPNKIQHTGDTDTYLQFVGENDFRIVTGNVEQFSANSTNGIEIPDKIRHMGDTDTYMQFHADNQWRVVTGGTEMLEVNDTYVQLGAHLHANGQNLIEVEDIGLRDRIYHDGDTDTYMQFGNNQWNVYVGNHREITVDTSGVRLGDTGNGYFQPVSGNYGSIQIDGGAHGGWEGYSIGGRVVFMHDNGGTSGIYNDVNNEWLAIFRNNAEVELMYNGAEKFATTSSGANINGTLSLSGTGRITGIDTVSAATDAANKAYVDNNSGNLATTYAYF